MPQIAIPAAFYRGGTSRAVFFRADDLQGYDDRAKTAIILAAMGSPDPFGRQIDGLGGGISSLSKAAIVGKALPTGPADVTFRFAQVDTGNPLVEFNGTCGNISAAVAPFAIDEGLVAATSPVTSVSVADVNTGQLFVSRVSVTREGQAETEGDLGIAGVAGKGAPVEVEYQGLSGSLGSGLLPTGHVREPLSSAGGDTIETSIVDAVNPMVYVRARDVGLSGIEAADAIDADGRLCQLLGDIRARAAVRLGLAASLQEADKRSQAVPKIVIVSPPADYVTSSGAEVVGSETDLIVRMMSMGKCHRAIAASTAICTAVAAAIDDSLVREVARFGTCPSGRVRIGHPAGVLTASANVEHGRAGWVVRSASTFRTARRIMSGQIYVPSRYLAGTAWFQTGLLVRAQADQSIGKATRNE